MKEDHPKTTSHNYHFILEKFLLDNNKALKNGILLSVSVKHDPWCEVLNLKKRGFCNCNPKVVLDNLFGDHEV